MNGYHIVLADDHIMLRQGLKKLLEEKIDIKVIGEAGDGLDLLSLLKRLVPHMVILDISMPNLRGIEAIHEIKCMHPEIKILVLTMHKDEEYLYQALSAGAEGYLLKEDADKALFSAIEKIRRGQVFISSHLMDGLTGDWANVRIRKQRCFKDDQLTIREREILKLVAEGKSSKVIADILFISVRTTEHHRANITNKLNLKNTADLVKYALHKGYVQSVC